MRKQTLKKKRKAALAYAKAGYPVFPLHYPMPDGSCSCANPECEKNKRNKYKHPVTPNGFKDATTDIEQIKACWSRNPYNIGVKTGNDSFICIDVDGKEGRESMKRLESENGPLPPTVTAKTGNGFHLFFKAPEVSIPCSVRKVDEGIDVRGNGGYVVMPPSDHYSGCSYEFMEGLGPNDVEMAIMPEWLIELATQTKKTRTHQKKSNADIPMGKRNDTLFKRGCALRGRGASSKALTKKLLKINSEQCKPPLDDSEVKKIVTSVSKYKKGDQKALSTVFLEVLEQSLNLFHTPLNEAYAKIPIDDHHEIWPIRSSEFKIILQRLFFQQFNITLKKNTHDEIADLLEAKARFEAPKEDVHVRIAGDLKAIYIDLCNANYDFVEITPSGYRIIKTTPYNFRRAPGMKALPLPVESKKGLKLIRKFLPADPILIASWIISAFHPSGPYLILAVHGPQGSAKSTTTMLLKNLIDPNEVPIRTIPKDEHDLMIAIRNSWLSAFDNLSDIKTWLSDAFCRLSTGGGLSTRTLYTDTGEQLFQARKPLILNGISNLIERPDLMDRAIFVYFPTIHQAERKTEESVLHGFEAVKPMILDGIYKCISVALANRALIDPKKLPRMADAAKWICAAEPALPWSEGKFLWVYNKMILKTREKLSQDDAIIRTCRRLLKRKKSWKGTPTELLSKLNDLADPEELAGLPKSASHLTKMIKKRSVMLDFAGLKVKFGRKPGYRWIRIKRSK